MELIARGLRTDEIAGLWLDGPDWATERAQGRCLKPGGTHYHHMSRGFRQTTLRYIREICSPPSGKGGSCRCVSRSGLLPGKRPVMLLHAAPTVWDSWHASRSAFTLPRRAPALPRPWPFAGGSGCLLGHRSASATATCTPVRESTHCARLSRSTWRDSNEPPGSA